MKELIAEGTKDFAAVEKKEKATLQQDIPNLQTHDEKVHKPPEKQEKRRK